MAQIEFNGFAVIVTGGSSGIGAEIVRTFARSGASIVYGGRNIQNLLAVQKECVSNGIASEKIRWIAGDLREESTRKQLVDCAISNYGKIDILVNNAGTVYLDTMENIKFSEYDEVMDINAGSIFKLTSICIPHLKDTKGNVINISSIASTTPLPMMTPYCMSKAALDMLTKCAASELGPFGIRVNAIAPGTFPTSIDRNVRMDKTFKEVHQSSGNVTIIDESIPLGRLGYLNEIANVVLFLASSRASYITGAIVPVDGGFNCTSTS